MGSNVRVMSSIQAGRQSNVSMWYLLWLHAPSPETGTGKAGLMAHWTAVAPVTQRCRVAQIQQDADAASRNMLSGWDDLPHSSKVGVGQRRYDQQER